MAAAAEHAAAQPFADSMVKNGVELGPGGYAGAAGEAVWRPASPAAVAGKAKSRGQNCHL